RGSRNLAHRAGPRNGRVVAQSTGSGGGNRADGPAGTFSSPANLSSATAVRVRDERDRLAVRLRTLARLGAEHQAESEEVAAEGTAPLADLAWLQVEPTSLLRRLDAVGEGASPQLAAWAKE